MNEVDRSQPGTRRGIVVGIDGSPGSLHALAWAAEHVDRFGPVRPLAAWMYPTWAMANPMMGTPPPVSVESFETAARTQAEEVIASIPPEDRADLIVTRSSAGPALVEAGADAELIAVGTRGRGAVADTLLGSVSSHVVANATVPTAVVPIGAPLGRPHRRALVGVDGSAHSVHALRWAIDNCLHAGESDVVEAVHVWSHHVTAIPEPYMVPSEYSETEAKQTLDRVVDEAVEATGGDSSGVELTLEYGDPRSVLRRFADRADLLVVGSRGHRGVAHLLLGSVTTGLVHQPLIATVVVP
jgi:nucleotide-binding universal stress UspA family protein